MWLHGCCESPQSDRMPALCHRSIEESFMPPFTSLHRALATVALAGGLLASGLALAGACRDHYVDGRAPEIRNAKLGNATTELCYGVFGVMHSGITRTPLWSAEH